MTSKHLYGFNIYKNHIPKLCVTQWKPLASNVTWVTVSPRDIYLSFENLHQKGCHLDRIKKTKYNKKLSLYFTVTFLAENWFQKPTWCTRHFPFIGLNYSCFISRRSTNASILRGHEEYARQNIHYDCVE